MKNIFNSLIGVLAIASTLIACSPEEFTGADGNIPQISDYEESFEITVDQETNFAYFDFKSTKGVSPIWIVNGSYLSDYSFSKFYWKKGTYSVECKVKSKNGISDGSILKEFTIDNTKIESFGGFNEQSEYNLFKDNEFKVASFWYAPGWSQIADPAYTYNEKEYVVKLPTATTEQWQAQMHVELVNTIALTSDKSYDFSIIMFSNTKHPGVTVKLQQNGNDDNFMCQERVPLEANQAKCFWFSNVKGTDITNLKFAFDFGGNAANTEITLTAFVLKEHSNDDGTVLPEE